jgi:hypothetical protein
MITDPATVAVRAIRMIKERVVETRDGSMIPMDPETICIHSDTTGHRSSPRIFDQLWSGRVSSSGRHKKRAPHDCDALTPTWLPQHSRRPAVIRSAAAITIRKSVAGDARDTMRENTLNSRDRHAAAAAACNDFDQSITLLIRPTRFGANDEIVIKQKNRKAVPHAVEAQRALVPAGTGPHP